MIAANGLTEYFCKKYNIDPHAEYEIEYINAKELLVYNRIDIVAKIVWLRAYDTERNIAFADKLYERKI